MGTDLISKAAINSIMESRIYAGFEDIERYRGDTNPSEVARMLEHGWGLGDHYAEWFTEAGEGYW